MYIGRIICNAEFAYVTNKLRSDEGLQEVYIYIYICIYFNCYFKISKCFCAIRTIIKISSRSDIFNL
jgi:hypothetical protein